MEEVDRLTKIVWDYHLMHQLPQKVDCLLVLGSTDLRVAEYAAKLFLKDYAPVIICSGGFGRLSKGTQEKSEANIFAEIMIALGVPEDKIIRESQSTNTSENFTLSNEAVQEARIKADSYLIVTKPYMERRALATFQKRLPNKTATVTSPPLNLEEYPTDTITKEFVINMIVGDLQRIKAYGEQGFLVPQAIPAEVWTAGQKLAELGYDQYALK